METIFKEKQIEKYCARQIDLIKNINAMCVDSIIYGKRPILSFFAVKLMDAFVWIQKTIVSFTYMDVSHLVTTRPDSIIIRHFYIKKDEYFQMRGHLWLMAFPGLPFVIKKNDANHKNMIYNDKQLNKNTKHRIVKYLKSKYMFTNIFALWESSKIKRKGVEASAKILTKTFTSQQKHN